MRGILVWLMTMMMGLAIAGCSTSGTPATVPETVVSTVATATTISEPPAASTTTTETTTTVDRVAEIEAIFQDLEERRLRALYDGDVEAFTALFANEEYMQRSLGLFDLIEFAGPPQPGRVVVESVVHVDDECAAAEVLTDYTEVLSEGATAAKIVVLEHADGVWGISYTGEGWTCVGPHPLSP